MSQTSRSLVEASTIVWANRVLIASAALFIYDSILNLPTEIRLYKFHSRYRRQLIPFIPLRNTSLVYQIVVICGISWVEFTPQRFLAQRNCLLWYSCELATECGTTSSSVSTQFFRSRMSHSSVTDGSTGAFRSCRPFNQYNRSKSIVIPRM
ncbi:hypothetical protein B0H17DRAFT_282941 [Mycena rosella]|uniref:Uncharacterized protein n=1 Tax=Mycena rosella TaxID=1033263 RepID=A0AAD7CW86_MYCRO|nr:hypothetical protein B0H17DRAFT_282941 [Mycena rosella]